MPIDLLLTVQRKPNHRSKPKINKRVYGNSIELRTKEVQARLEFGHFEGDSIMGADNSGHIITPIERKTRDGFMFVFKEFSNKNIKFVKKILQIRFDKLFYKIFKSITFDNGIIYKMINCKCTTLIQAVPMRELPTKTSMA